MRRHPCFFVCALVDVTMRMCNDGPRRYTGDRRSLYVPLVAETPTAEVDVMLLADREVDRMCMLERHFFTLPCCVLDTARGVRSQRRRNA
jgi:hypothetical protein